MVKVLLEQQVITQYRIPFFSRLAGEVELLVVASENVKIPGVVDVRDNLSFQSIRLPEGKRKPYGEYHHRGITDLLGKFQPQVHISGDFLATFLAHPAYYFRLFEVKPSLIEWGCRGFNVKDFSEYRNHLLANGRLLQHPKGWLSNNIQKFYFHRLDGFLAYSEYTSRYYQEVHRIPAFKISVAYNSIDVTPFLQRRRSLERSGTTRVPGQILFVGRLTMGKEVDILLQAYARIKRRYPSISLRIIGDGPELNALKALATNLSLGDVKFLGGIYDQYRLAELMYSASLFVMPGLGGLGFNAAMAVGLPIICGRADGTERHLVVNNYNGFYYDGSVEGLTRVLEMALDQPEKMAAMGRCSADLIETLFNLDTMVEAFLDRISKVVVQSGRFSPAL